MMGLRRQWFATGENVPLCSSFCYGSLVNVIGYAKVKKKVKRFVRE